MTVAVTVMLLFGTMMAAIAELALRSGTQIHVLWLLPFLVLAVVIGFYLLSLLTIHSMPGSLVEFDGKTLSVGAVGSERRTSWPREKIKSITVSRLPMVPIANLVIQPEGNPAVRAGVCRQRDLEPVAARLRQAMGLNSRKRK
jgi:hypothetical protein